MAAKDEQKWGRGGGDIGGGMGVRGGLRVVMQKGLWGMWWSPHLRVGGAPMRAKDEWSGRGGGSNSSKR